MKNNNYHFENIPEELKNTKQWVCWQAVEDPKRKKIKKVPINPRTGQGAKSNDKKTWVSFQQAFEFYEANDHIAGIGFMFTPPYFGVDIDDCVGNPEGEALIKEFTETLNSYAEYSPSGKGIHIICKGTIPQGGNRKGNIEIYDKARYFTVTGNTLRKTSCLIKDSTDKIVPLFNKYISNCNTNNSNIQDVVSVKNSEINPSKNSILTKDDMNLIEKILQSRKGQLFKRLFLGKWEGLYNSQSEADFAFCSDLAFWTNKATEQIDRIFRNSKLFRSKWDINRGGTTYGQDTIRKACNSVYQGYKPSKKEQTKSTNTGSIYERGAESASPSAPLTTGGFSVFAAPSPPIDKSQLHENSNIIDKSKFHKYDKKGNPTSIFDFEIVKYILKTEHLFVLNNTLYMYQNGVYIKTNGNDLKTKIQSLLYDDFITIRNINRVYELILIQDKLQRESWELNQFPKHWINFKNGMYDAVKDKLLLHSPKYYSINQIPHNYKKIKKEDFYKYVNTNYFFATSLSPDDIKTIFQFMGICMTHNTDFQFFLLLLGEGGNGKSIMISLFNAIVGFKNTSNVSLKKLADNQFSTSQLFGKLMNSCADISKIAIEDDAEIKKITGGDLVECEFKGKDAFPFTPYSKLLFSANRFPHVDDKSEAFKRRTRIVNMNKKPEKIIINLKEKLLNEIEYWIALAVEGLKEVIKTSEVHESQESKEIKLEVHKKADSVLAFIDDCLIKTEGLNIPRSEVFNEYKKYCEFYERQPISKSNFFDEMKAKNIILKKTMGNFVFENLSFKIWNDNEKNPFL